MDETLSRKSDVGDATEQQGERQRRDVTYDALILDAKLRQSLVTVRSLGQHGKRVAALATEDNLVYSDQVPIFSSRWCQQSYIAPSYKNGTQPYLHYLLQLVRSTGIGVLIPSADGTVELLRAHRQELEQWGSRVALTKEAALATAVNKEQTLQVAKHLGLNVPHGVLVRTVDEIAEALREVGLPAVIKPVSSWRWGEQEGVRLISRLVTSLDEARQVAETISVVGSTMLVQQFLRGRREAVSFLYANGEFYARFAQWAKRTHPQLGGTSVYRQSIAVPRDLGEPAERLVQELDLEGYSEVEFRRDSAGRPYLMEINPRLSASVELAVRAGVDFPYMLYRWAAGERIERVQGYRVGEWMRYLEGDLLALVESFRQHGRPGIQPPAQALWEFVSTFFLPTGYDYMDKHDPLPAWTAFREFADHVWYHKKNFWSAATKIKSTQ